MTQKNKIREIIVEQQKALAVSKCSPQWCTFEKTYNWYLLRQKMSVSEQDEFCEKWFQVYREQKMLLGKLAGQPRSTAL